MKKLLVALLAIPCGALAAPPGASAPAAPPDATAQFERMEQRMRTARAMGLVEALGLNDSEATRLRKTLTAFDDRRTPLLRGVHDGMVLLSDAASGSLAAQKQVDDAVKSVFDARAKVEELDREMYQVIAKDLSPEKRARAAVFLARFQGRFGMGMGPGGGKGGGPGMNGGEGPGGRRGMGPGKGGMHGP